MNPNLTLMRAVSEGEVRCCVISRDGWPSLNPNKFASLNGIAVLHCAIPEARAGAWIVTRSHLGRVTRTGNVLITSAVAAEFPRVWQVLASVVQL